MFLVVTSLYIICDLQIKLNVDILIVGDIKWIEHIVLQPEIQTA